MAAIEVDRLVKAYRNVKAVRGVTFQVRKGEIFGMLGPNGAGKTTTIECMTGLKEIDGGNVRVLGMHPGKSRRALYARIGVQLQETSWQDKVRVDEICRLFSSLYQNPAPWEELLKKFGLQDKRRAYVGSLSGGQRQKLSVILALLPRPEIVFLDELTTGLDPKARRAMWDHIRNLRDEGCTVFMTTHYMEEAEALCDRVCVIRDGAIVALDTVPEVIRKAGLPETVSFDSDVSLKGLLRNAFPEASVEQKGTSYAAASAGSNFSGSLIAWLESGNIPYRNMNIRKPTLEDAYLKLTGIRLEDEE